MTRATSEQVRWMIADLEGFPDNGHRYEIIDRELFVTGASHLDHQDVAGLIYGSSKGFVKKNKPQMYADNI